jgi:hypothetical protein
MASVNQEAHLFSHKVKLIVAGAVCSSGKGRVVSRGSFPSTCGNHQEEAAAGHRLSISIGEAASTARSRFFFWIENRGSLEQILSRQDGL